MDIFKLGMAVGLTTFLATEIQAVAPPPPRPVADALPAVSPPPSRNLIGSRREICGDALLLGERLPAIVGTDGCGVEAPVRLESVASVALDPPAIVACETARALSEWLANTATAKGEGVGTKLQALAIAGGYSCRNRNRAVSGELSEHALGHAIDISAFRMQGGTWVTVRDGWNSADFGPMLRRLRKAGCGPFSTVLGPGSDSLHADHFHFDVKERSSGPWCK